MDQKNYNLKYLSCTTITSKFILPLIIPIEKRYLLSNKYGFVDCACNDINKPFLDDHIFLIFKSIPNYKDHTKRHEELIIILNFYTWYQCKINNIYYNIYVFTRQTYNPEHTKAIKDILNGDITIVPYKIKQYIAKYHMMSIECYEHEQLFTVDEILLTKDLFKNEFVKEYDQPEDGIYYDIEQLAS